MLKRNHGSILNAKLCYNFWSDSIWSTRRGNQQVFCIWYLLPIWVGTFLTKNECHIYTIVQKGKPKYQFLKICSDAHCENIKNVPSKLLKAVKRSSSCEKRERGRVQLPAFDSYEAILREIERRCLPIAFSCPACLLG